MIKKCLTALLAGVFALAALPVLPMAAQEDFSNEDYWYERCSKTQTSAAGVKACTAFLEYTKEKQDSLSAQIEDYNKSLSDLQKSAEEMEALVAQQRSLVEELDEKVAQKQARIAEIESSIESVQKQIADKEEEISSWDAQIRSRMQDEQATVGTNMIIDVLMGAGSFTDMIRRLTGLERITESDQSQVDQLNIMKEELSFQKEDLERVYDTLSMEQAALNIQLDQAQALQDSYQELETQYRQQLAEIKQAKMDAQKDMEYIKQFSINASQILSDTVLPVEGLIFPVKGGSYSAGTWAYPGGGLHLGIDWAAPIGTSVVAPADGIILYANNPVASNSGYLGNWTGHPAGGGNTVAMLVNLNGTMLGITFAHLAQEGMSVKAGDTVTQGQKLAETGNSGNSSGAHCHIEVINLGQITAKEAVALFSESADFAFGTGWGTTATTCEASGTTPCRERPEKYFMSKE